MGTHLAVLATLPDADLRRTFEGRSVQSLLYSALRREQAALIVARRPEREVPAILAFANAAVSELEAALAGRTNELLDHARDGEWTLRDLLRHAIAVEVRYRSQILYSARRPDDSPIDIPNALLPCDRLAPPEAAYGGTLTATLVRMLELLRHARRDSDDALLDVPLGALVRPSRWGGITVDVRERLHQIGAHLVEVIVQTDKMLGTQESEARRIVRRIAAVRGLHERSSDGRTLAHLDAELGALASMTAIGG